MKFYLIDSGQIEDLKRIAEYLAGTGNETGNDEMLFLSKGLISLIKHCEKLEVPEFKKENPNLN